MRYELSHHAAEMLCRRGIQKHWLEETLDSSHQVAADANNPNIVHRFRVIEECDRRVLRVLYNRSVSPVRVVSMLVDRRIKVIL